MHLAPALMRFDVLPSDAYENVCFSAGRCAFFYNDRNLDTALRDDWQSRSVRLCGERAG